jgi:hypothetical protein
MTFFGILPNLRLDMCMGLLFPYLYDYIKREDNDWEFHFPKLQYL